MSKRKPVLVTTPFYWSDSPDEPRERGVRVSRGHHFIFISDNEILNIANQLANHIATNNNTNN